MKNLLLILATCFILFSCSNNDDEIQNVTTSFFNINTGNKWVYNKYDVNNGVSVLSKIDSVFVLGDTLINLISYKKILHKNHYIFNPSSGFIEYEYLRVDANDHLVNSGGLVLHPGFDSQYQHTRDYLTQEYFDPVTNSYIQDSFGTATFQNVLPQNITVEGHNYFGYDYQGSFIGNSSLNIQNGITSYIYSEGIGLILERYHFIGVPSPTTNYFENRLVYYEIN